MGMCNLNLPNLFGFTNWECCNVGRNRMFINLQHFFTDPFFLAGLIHYHLTAAVLWASENESKSSV